MPKATPTRARAVVKNDSADLPNPNAFIYVGGDGNMKVTTEEGDVVTFMGLSAGDIVPISIARVWSAVTTATNMVALW